MTTRDVGDRLNLRHLVYDAAGALTNATVLLTVTDPSGDVTTPTPTNSATGTYDASFTLTEAGTWTWRWAISGAVVDVEDGSILAADPAPPTYASLAALKARISPDATNTSHDAEFLDALLDVSREIENYCGRSFHTSAAASARLFYPTRWDMAKVHDFYTTTDLEIAVDHGNDGTYETVWSASDYQLEPLNGIVDGQVGWPFWRIRAVGNHRFPCVSSTSRAPLRVTARWGWAAVPDPVRDACLILAVESFKLPDSPFGVGGWGPYGIVRVRENPTAARKLNPYRLDPILVG